MENSRMITGLIVFVGGLILGLVVIMEVLVGRGNNLANLAKFVAIGSLALGVVNGRLGIYWLILLFAYADLFKRMMVYFGRISFIDITFVLSIAPLVCGGVVISYFMAMLFGRLENNPRNWKLFWICSFITAGSAAYVVLLQNQGLLTTLKSLAHQSVYIMLVWVFYVATPTRAEIRSFMKFTLYAFIPVGAYGIWQGFVGLSAFEEEYLRLGLSIEAKYLREGVTHAFSTMSSAKSFGIVMVFCAGIAMFLNRERGGGFNIITVLLVLMFLLAAFFCMNRASWLVALAMFAGCLCFGSKFRTWGLYATAALTLGLLIVFSNHLLQNWSKITSQVEGVISSDSARGNQAFRVSTFSARLVGLRNLATNPEMWSWFGVDKETQNSAEATSLGTGLTIDKMSSMLAHDALSKFILNYGIVPAAILGIVGIYVLFWMHSIPHRFRHDKTQKRIFVMLLACVFAGMSAGFTSGTFPFPINAFIFMFLAFLIRLYDQSMAEMKSKKAAVKNESKSVDLAAMRSARVGAPRLAPPSYSQSS